MPCDACALREPQAPKWPMLLAHYWDGSIDARTFHDAFLDTWRYARDHGFAEPKPIADLFFVVEAFTPETDLQGGAYDATETEMKSAVEHALIRLAAEHAGDLRP